MTDAAEDRGRRQVAVIYNPIKVEDPLRELIAVRVAEAGWLEPRWLETTEDDPGRQMAADVGEADVDLVIVAGGDGTVRAVAGGLADSGVALGIIPQGTGNLLARNLGIPLDSAAAIDVAVNGHERRLDIVAITTDDAPERDRFAVMAGLGLDAAIMSNTDSVLKDRIGAMAYVVAATQQLRRRPQRMRVTVDDQQTVSRKAMICLVGNVGAIQGEVELLPGAEPDDGLLDVVVASPRRVRHWLAVATRILTGRQRTGDRIDQLAGRRVVVELDQPDDYQLDGDTIGSCRRLVAEVEPGALMIRVPATDGTS